MRCSPKRHWQPGLRSLPPVPLLLLQLLLLPLLLLQVAYPAAAASSASSSSSLSVSPAGSVTWTKSDSTLPLPYGISVVTPGKKNESAASVALSAELRAAVDAYAALLAADAAALEAAKLNHDAKAGIRLALVAHASGLEAAKARAKVAVVAALANAAASSPGGARCPNVRFGHLQRRTVRRAVPHGLG